MQKGSSLHLEKVLDEWGCLDYPWVRESAYPWVRESTVRYSLEWWNDRLTVFIDEDTGEVAFEYTGSPGQVSGGAELRKALSSYDAYKKSIKMRKVKEVVDDHGVDLSKRSMASLLEMLRTQAQEISPATVSLNRKTLLELIDALEVRLALDSRNGITFSPSVPSVTKSRYK